MTRFAVLLLLTACAAQSGDIAEEPFIRGTITHIERDSITVEENPADQSGSKKAILRLDDETTVTPVPSRSLRRGDIVSVWINGSVQKSYPVQATALRIVVEPR